MVQLKSNTEKWTGTTDENGVISFGAGSSADHAMDYNTIYKVTETKAPAGYVVNSEPIYIMVPRKEENAADYSDYVNGLYKDSKIHKQYKSTYELTVYNHKGEITVEKKFKDAGGHNSSPVSGTYKFGLYENADGTNTTNSTNPEGTTSITAPLQTITITYNAAEKDSKTAKFTNLDLTKTYYVFELDDNGNPIKDSTTVATVNKMEYFTSYATTKTDGDNRGKQRSQWKHGDSYKPEPCKRTAFYRQLWSPYFQACRSGINILRRTADADQYKKKSL